MKYYTVSEEVPVKPWEEDAWRNVKPNWPNLSRFISHWRYCSDTILFPTFWERVKAFFSVKYRNSNTHTQWQDMHYIDEGYFTQVENGALVPYETNNAFLKAVFLKRGAAGYERFPDEDVVRKAEEEAQKAATENAPNAHALRQKADELKQKAEEPWREFARVPNNGDMRYIEAQYELLNHYFVKP